MSDEGVARYSYKINVSSIAVGDGILDVPMYKIVKQFIHYGEHSSPLQLYNLRVEALDKF